MKRRKYRREEVVTLYFESTHLTVMMSPGTLVGSVKILLNVTVTAVVVIPPARIELGSPKVDSRKQACAPVPQVVGLPAVILIDGKAVPVPMFSMQSNLEALPPAASLHETDEGVEV